jgi:hypothetical protein
VKAVAGKYRMTNKPAPDAASPYIEATLLPLRYIIIMTIIMIMIITIIIIIMTIIIIIITLTREFLSLHSNVVDYLAVPALKNSSQSASSKVIDEVA